MDYICAELPLDSLVSTVKFQERNERLILFVIGVSPLDWLDHVCTNEGTVDPSGYGSKSSGMRKAHKRQEQYEEEKQAAIYQNSLLPRGERVGAEPELLVLGKPGDLHALALEETHGRAAGGAPPVVRYLVELQPGRDGIQWSPNDSSYLYPQDLHSYIPVLRTANFSSSRRLSKAWADASAPEFSSGNCWGGCSCCWVGPSSLDTSMERAQERRILEGLARSELWGLRLGFPRGSEMEGEGCGGSGGGCRECHHCLGPGFVLCFKSGEDPLVG